MSNIYIQEPPTTGKVLVKTTVGDIDIELWTREAPKACRNFIQLCLEGYYNNTIFHRVVKGFIVQGGDPTGTGQGGDSIYGQPFKDEFHTRLRFCRRGLLAMANAGKDDNGSQFFFTLAASPELQNKHTIFGKVAGETIYNMLKLENGLVDDDERPQYPQKILKTEVLLNPFSDIIPRVLVKDDDKTKEKKKPKKAGIKNFKLLSFGEEAEVDEEESADQNKKLVGKSKSRHDNTDDPNLSNVVAVEPAGPPSKKKIEDRSSDWESDEEDTNEETVAKMTRARAEMKQRIFEKLKEKKTASNVAKKRKYREDGEKSDEETYYFGKDRDDERKRKAEEIRKQIKELKREVHKNKKVKVDNDKKQREKESKANEYTLLQEQYKDVKVQLPKKGSDRAKHTLSLLDKFKNKLQSNMEETTSESSKLEGGDNSHSNDSWIGHSFTCEDKKPVLAKDANRKDDDWFEIYDPRNPLNKRRRGEGTKSRSDRPRHRR